MGVDYHKKVHNFQMGVVWFSPTSLFCWSISSLVHENLPWRSSEYLLSAIVNTRFKSLKAAVPIRFYYLMLKLDIITSVSDPWCVWLHMSTGALRKPRSHGSPKTVSSCCRLQRGPERGCGVCEAASRVESQLTVLETDHTRKMWPTWSDQRDKVRERESVRWRGRPRPRPTLVVHVR